LCEKRTMCVNGLSNNDIDMERKKKEKKKGKALVPHQLP